MTKTMSKARYLLAFLAAAVLALALSSTAWAANDASITINVGTPQDSQSNVPEYKYYKILDADIANLGEVGAATGVTSGPGTVAYFVDSQAKADALDGTHLFKVTKVNDSRWNIELVDETTSAEDIATALSKIVSTFGEAVDLPLNAEKTTASATNLAPGYYLVTSSLGTNIAVQTLGNVTINEKNQYPSNTKTEDKTTASIGETVTYTVNVSIPNSVAEKPIVVVDKISDGLTMNTAITVTGTINDALTALTFVQDEQFTEVGFTQYKATIPAGIVSANPNGTIVLTYTATVNGNAVVNEAEKNDAHIEYDNFVSKDIEVEVVTHGFTLKKIDGADVTDGMTDEQKFELAALNGAEFSLWTAATGGTQIKVTAGENGVYRVDPEAAQSAAIAAGQATIEGLAASTYYLQEDVAPAGYNLLNTRQEVVVSAATSAEGVDIAVENNGGTQLPSTGGMGTTILYVVGGILVAGAVIFLIVRGRMRKESDLNE